MAKDTPYFEIIRDWFQYQLESQKTKPIHSALFLYIVEKFNSLWWPDEIGLPTDFTMIGTGIGSYNTYKKTLDQLNDFGFIIIGERGRNQYVATKVALSFFDKAYTKARDKARYKALIKQVSKQLSDNKQLNNETVKQVNSLKESVDKLKGENDDLKLKLAKLESTKIKVADLSFISEFGLNGNAEGYAELFKKWIQFKKEQFRFTYKSNTSMKTAFNELLKLSESNLKNAEKIVNKSIANGYRGLVELKPHEKFAPTKKTTTLQLQYLVQLTDGKRPQQMSQASLDNALENISSQIMSYTDTYTNQVTTL